MLGPLMSFFSFNFKEKPLDPHTMKMVWLTLVTL